MNDKKMFECLSQIPPHEIIENEKAEICGYTLCLYEDKTHPLYGDARYAGTLYYDNKAVADIERYFHDTLLFPYSPDERFCRMMNRAKETDDYCRITKNELTSQHVIRQIVGMARVSIFDMLNVMRSDCSLLSDMVDWERVLSPIANDSETRTLCATWRELMNAREFLTNHNPDRKQSWERAIGYLNTACKIYGGDLPRWINIRRGEYRACFKDDKERQIATVWKNQKPIWDIFIDSKTNSEYAFAVKAETR